MVPAKDRLVRDTTIVVPCFNEAQLLSVFAFGQFVAACDRSRLLLVNDGSHDKTLDVLHALESRHPDSVFVLDLGRNYGKAEAVRRGVLRALADGPAYCGYWDADLATPLEAIPDFCRILDRHDEIDLVIGCRIPLLGHRIKRRRTRCLLGRLFARVASTVLGLPIRDTQCGAKLFRATPEAAAVFAEPFTTRWIFDVEILARLTQFRSVAGRRPLADTIYEFALDSWLDVPGSKLAARDFLVAFVDMARICRSFWRRPPARAIAPPPYLSERSARAAREQTPSRRAA
jgi:glycosyltransferase involved in cell wall biosynthesis